MEPQPRLWYSSVRYVPTLGGCVALTWWVAHIMSGNDVPIIRATRVALIWFNTKDSTKFRTCIAGHRVSAQCDSCIVGGCMPCWRLRLNLVKVPAERCTQHSRARAPYLKISLVPVISALPQLQQDDGVAQLRQPVAAEPAACIAQDQFGLAEQPMSTAISTQGAAGGITASDFGFRRCSECATSFFV